MCTLGIWVVRWNHWMEVEVVELVVGGSFSDITEDGWIPCESTLWGTFRWTYKAPHCTTTVTSYTTPQSFSLFSIPSLSFSLLIHSLFSSPSLSGLRLSVPPKPPYQHVWLMKKGNVCRNSIILTCWWQGERWGGGGLLEKKKQRKEEKNSTLVKRHSMKCN